MSDMSPPPVLFYWKYSPGALENVNQKILKIECLRLAENAFSRLLQLVLFVFRGKQIAFLKISGHKCIILKNLALQSNEKVLQSKT